MTKIKLIFYEDSWKCDDCGPIYDEHLRVEKEGVEVLRLDSDGHFGNGDNLRDPMEVLKTVLQALGYEVELINEG